MFDVQNTESIADLLARRHPDFPQSVVAGWLLPDGQPVAAAFIHSDRVPTTGELAVAHASCLAAVLKRIDELAAEEPEAFERCINLVLMMVGSLEVVKRLKNDLFTEERGRAVAATA